MKRVFYILAAALLGAMACTKEASEMPKPATEESGLVAIKMQLTIPVPINAQTKAGDRAELPRIDDIHVAVFGTSGYPQAYSLAEPIDADGNSVSSYATTNGDTYYFKVLLPVYDGEAHVHIIANGDPSITFVDQNENSIMSVMKTQDNVGAYWGRIVLPDGILTQKNDDGIMQTDDEGNFIPDDATADAFKNLTLIRNFAEVSLIVEDGAGISDVSWALVNTPVSGSVAPMADGTYVDEYKDYVYNTSTGKMVLDGKEYNGYMVSSELSTDVPAASQITTSADAPLFSYERVDPNKTQPAYLMLKAKFGSDSDYSYYRVDMMDENVGGYFPLYRNYKYQIKIHKVGNRGASTPDEAANRNSGGNVSMSAETKTLTDVSDGTSRLYVEFVEKTYTTGGTKSFWVYYIPDVTTGTIDNTKIEVSIKDQGNALASSTIELDSDNSTATGLYFYTFTVNDQSAIETLSSVIQVKASNGETGDDKSTLYRDLTVKVMKKMDMVLSLNPKKVDETIGKKTVLHIALSDTLQASMFPMEFYIEDSNRTLNPTGKDGGGNTIAVPVQLGTSLYDPTNTNSYHYIRTVNYSEYEPMLAAWKAADAAGESTEGIIDFTTEFQTIVASSKTTIYVDNEYFNMQHVNLLNDGLYLDPANQTVDHEVTSVTINVEAGDQTTEWSVLAGEGVTLDTASGTGDGSFTMTFAENESYGSDKTYTAAVTSGGKTYTVTITQKARTFTITPATQTLLYNATSATFKIKVEEDVEWTATFDGTSLSATSGTGPATLTATFDANTLTASKTYTATITVGDIQRTATIVLSRLPASSYPFSYSAFTVSDNASSATSTDGYVTIDMNNVYRGNNYIRMSTNNSAGTMTVTPVSGMKITQVVITYAAANYAQAAGTGVVSTGTYTLSSTTGTWTLDTTSSATMNFSGTGNNNGRRISSIVVYYEAAN